MFWHNIRRQYLQMTFVDAPAVEPAPDGGAAGLRSAIAAWDYLRAEFLAKGGRDGFSPSETSAENP